MHSELYEPVRVAQIAVAAFIRVLLRDVGSVLRSAIRLRLSVIVRCGHVVRFRVRVGRVEDVRRFVFDSVLSCVFLKRLYQYRVQRVRPTYMRAKRKTIRVLRQDEYRYRVAMVIEDAKRPLRQHCLEVLAPYLRLDVFTTLRHRTRLWDHVASVYGLSIRVRTVRAYPIAIAALLRLIAVLIVTRVLRCGRIVRSNVRPFRWRVNLRVAGVHHPVGKATSAIQVLELRPFHRLSGRTLASCYHGIRVLVMYLQHARANEPNGAYL